MNIKEIQEYNRKKIICAVHETEDYDEALKKELTQSGCQIESYTSPFSPKHKKAVISIVLWYEGIDCAGNDRYYCWRNDCAFTDIKKNFKIIGKPLTLDRVLISLGDDLLLSRYHQVLSFRDNRHEDWQDWDLSKETLEDQDNKVQLSIAKLLGYDK